MTAHKLRLARGPKPPRWYCLKDRWVILKDGADTCWACGDWFTFGEEVRHQVLAGPGEFLSIYTCFKCNDGKTDTNWERVFGEEKEKEKETVESIFREGEVDDVPF